MYVAILYGGRSEEKDVSMKSAKNIASSLADLGYQFIMIEASKEACLDLYQLDPKPDIFFIAMHGAYGEDGKIQGLLDSLELKYTHSGVIASAIATHKPTAKKIMSFHKIPTPEYCIITKNHTTTKHDISFAPPYIIKPASGGSSIDTFIINNPEDRLVAEALLKYNEIILEKYITGREVSIGILGNESIGCMELKMHNHLFYDFHAKYIDQKTEHICNPDLPSHIMEQLNHYALTMHNGCGCKVLSRADFIYDDINDKVYMLEINSHPGLTGTSSIIPMLALRNKNYSMPQLTKMIIHYSLAEYTEEVSLLNLRQ